jgi:hypothetical protein
MAAFGFESGRKAWFVAGTSLVLVAAAFSIARVGGSAAARAESRERPFAPETSRVRDANGFRVTTRWTLGAASWRADGEPEAPPEELADESAQLARTFQGLDLAVAGR